MKIRDPKLNTNNSSGTISYMELIKCGKFKDNVFSRGLTNFIL